MKNVSYSEGARPQFAMIKEVQEHSNGRDPMKAIEPIGDIDEHHRLRASVPEEFPAGPVRLIVLLSEEDEAGTAWARRRTTFSRGWTPMIADKDSLGGRGWTRMGADNNAIFW
jgi:hypothetical protein